ncbi:lysophospholipid acyltransferase family protein [Riemerella columbipharyngis]|uniref:1-acyl-sn-glycerol-3-phosphate acyltransferase n=1 Tax=Riemerella columbipharyngis TaxID=1071918 RepID=A0A1G6Y4Q6_9FLAO|nr:lysophospholipid acyltransferase family protein [Riemerella columbipharyngis]SDD84953.1 1-acyl-sn-glycerol-3-phosphate acyltransferase [Riemerella columbipharyngis]
MFILVYLWRLCFLILAVVFTVVFGIPAYILSFKRKHYKYCYFFVRLWCIVLFYGIGMRYKFISHTSKKIERNRQYIFIANHTSVLDIMLIVILLPHHPIFFVGKKELDRIPFFRNIYKRVAVLVDRKDARSRASVYQRCAERMKKGQNVVIYPEGGVPDDTSVILDNFKDGAFNMATIHGLPIVAFTFIGLKEMFPFDNKKGYPGCVKVFLEDILEPKGTLSEMKETAYNKMKQTLINE